MKTDKNFQSLIVWQKADLLYRMVCADIKNWPNTRITNSISFQLLDSAGSIGANIAEGYGRGSPREFEQFFRYSRGSMAETEDWLFKAHQQGLLIAERFEEYKFIIEELRKMSGAFISKLRLQPSKRQCLTSSIAR